MEIVIDIQFEQISRMIGRARIRSATARGTPVLEFSHTLAQETTRVYVAKMRTMFVRKPRGRVFTILMQASVSACPLAGMFHYVHTLQPLLMCILPDVVSFAHLIYTFNIWLFHHVGEGCP